MIFFVCTCSASGHLRVKQAFDHFEILDQTNRLQPPKVSVSSIELVKSLLGEEGAMLY